jgi:NADH-quinone oxidoreductase subunit J
MLFSTLLFYQFSILLIISSLFVVISKNTITSAMFLIFAFINASAIFLMLGAEFIAMLLIIVYVGAVAILFLFVVMMLDVDQRKNYTIKKYTTIFSLIGVVFLAQIYIIAKKSLIPTELLPKGYYFMSHIKISENITNSKAIGNSLYTDFFFQFQISGLILFVAMIGTIVLTLKENNNFNRVQKISKQVYRDRKKSVTLTNPEYGKGLDV